MGRREEKNNVGTVYEIKIFRSDLGSWMLFIAVNSFRFSTRIREEARERSQDEGRDREKTGIKSTVK